MTIRNAAGARAAKAKGRSWETACAEYLSLKLERTIERRRLTGVGDCGDLSGWEGRVIECKNTKLITLAGFIDELEAEKEAATRRFGVHHKGAAFIKRRGHTGVGEGYFLMKIKHGWELLR